MSSVLIYILSICSLNFCTVTETGMTKTIIVCMPESVVMAPNHIYISRTFISPKTNKKLVLKHQTCFTT